MNTLDEIIKIVKATKEQKTYNPDAYDHVGRKAFNKIAKLLENAELIEAEIKSICKHENIVPADDVEPYNFCNTCWEYIDEHGNVVNYVPEAVYKEMEDE